MVSIQSICSSALPQIAIENLLPLAVTGVSQEGLVELFLMRKTGLHTKSIILHLDRLPQDFDPRRSILQQVTQQRFVVDQRLRFTLS